MNSNARAQSPASAGNAQERRLASKGSRAVLFLATYVVVVLIVQAWSSIGPFQVPWFFVFPMFVALPEALLAPFLSNGPATLLGMLLFLAVAVAGVSTTNRRAFYLLYAVFLVFLALSAVSLIAGAFIAAMPA